MARDSEHKAKNANASAKPSGAQSIAVVGGGVIGLSLAWELAKDGANVTLFDAGLSHMAGSWAAAGMLAATVESIDEWPALQKFNRWCAELWPDYATAIETESRMSVGHKAKGTLLIKRPSQNGEGGAATGQNLKGEELRKLEPDLSPLVESATLHPMDHSVDTRSLLAALRHLCETRGVILEDGSPVERLLLNRDHVDGLIAGGAPRRFDQVCVAAGAWTPELFAASGLDPLPVRPIKGQMLCLQMDVEDPIVHHVIWAEGIYLVPRADGRLIIGATMEEAGFDVSVTAEAIAGLRLRAEELIPAICHLPVVETWAGLRAGSPDRAPFLGRYGAENLYVAAGHHRNGILQAPGTARLITEMMRLGEKPAIAAYFDPCRRAQC